MKTSFDLLSGPSAAPASARPMRLARRSTVWGLLVLASASMTGCGAMGPHHITVGSVPEDYRTRHPIIIAESEATLDVPVAANDHKLPSGRQEMVRGFAQRYKKSGSGVMRVMVPSGSLNAGAASVIAGKIRSALVHEGVPENRIITASYAADPQFDAAPIRLAFVAIAARTEPCGQWPADMIVDTHNNRNYENFGCASQNNLAAQIANPTDLIAPRAETPIDAERRKVVIDAYREGGATLSD